MTRLTFYNAINPVLIMSKFMGLVSFKITDKGYETSKLNMILNVILTILYIVMTLDSVYERLCLRTTTLLTTTTDIMQVGTAAVQIVVSWITSAFCQSHFISFLKRLANLDTKFFQLGVWIYYEKIYKDMKIRLIAHSVFVTISVAVQLFVYDYALTIRLVTFNFTYYFPTLINMVVVEQMCAYNNLLKARFDILNQHLADLQKSNRYELKKVSSVKLTNVLGSKLSILRIICPIHHELTKIAKMVNETLGIMLLLSFGVSFVTIIVSLYDCSISMQNFGKDKIKPLCGSLAMCSTYVLDCLYLCYNCHSTVEAANNAGRLLHQIDSNNDDVKDQIEMFSLQIVNERLEFSAAGFFPVNYSLVFSIIGGITTYLIILIQFSGNPKQKPT